MQENYKEDAEISLTGLIEKCKEWYRYFLTKWKLIILAGFIGALLGLAYTLSKKTKYIATLSFALEDDGNSGGLGGALGLASQFGLDIGGSGGGIFMGSNIVELFKSRAMVEKALLAPIDMEKKQTNLAEFYIEDKGWKKKWKDNPRLKKIDFFSGLKKDYHTREEDSILGVIYRDLSNNVLDVYQKDKKVSIISIDVISKNELFSKLFCENLAKEVSKFYIATKSKKSQINMDILKRQSDSVRTALNSAITGVAIADDNTFNLNPAMNVKRTPSSRKQVDVQANAAILTALVQQTELAKIALRKDTPLIQVIDRPILPLPNDKANKIIVMFLSGCAMVFFTFLYLIVKRLLS
ncbi:lipopolysaccharide biosynthesis protein [Flavobacterium sp. HTF]|uniref:lipopolysaccharide biosynthesis protein n=1 Tax=Flavobacterium sp. HTF TaxID=2170732 RepID=UPI000D5EB1E9|nr:lipopolysaccharide biosynthesis protein [Flavobacterium sp. HTF]PWB24566.1 lipopolysaccharide biosynthesis protein [Flavobacterium sp. HTF]